MTNNLQTNICKKVDILFRYIIKENDIGLDAIYAFFPSGIIYYHPIGSPGGSTMSIKDFDNELDFRNVVICAYTKYSRYSSYKSYLLKLDNTFIREFVIQSQDFTRVKFFESHYKYKEIIEVMNNLKMVNHPSHYTKGRYEVIDVIKNWGLNFNIGNAFKYIARCKYKGNCIQDLEKAIFYLEYEVNKCKHNSFIKKFFTRLYLRYVFPSKNRIDVNHVIKDCGNSTSQLENAILNIYDGHFRLSEINYKMAADNLKFYIKHNPE